MVEQLPSIAGKVKVFPNPINTHVFTPPAPGTGREAAGPRTIVYTGRVDMEKGLDLLVRAFRLVHERRPDARLRIIGPWGVNQGGGGEEFKRSLIDRAAGAPVEFTGPIYDRPALADALRGAHAYCYPSLAEKGEALPVAPIEAMATGVVPVVSKLKCFRDYLTDGVTGYFFDHTAAEADRGLAVVLERVLAGGPEVERVARRAAEVAGQFSIEQVADRYLEDLESLAGDGRVGARARGVA
jgi:glycosyltransferase involved in cell wall biosynthesis